MSGAARRRKRARRRQRCVLGIDVGGTSIRAGLVLPRSGSVRHLRAVPTPANDGRRALALTAAVARDVVEAGNRAGLSVERVGIGVPELVGRGVFCLHPHQDVFQAPIDMAVPVPDGIPLRRATLAANMETALNAVWDSGAGPADRVAVVGAGIVGLLVAYLSARLPGADVTVIDPLEERRALAEAFGARFASPLAGDRIAPSGVSREVGNPGEGVPHLCYCPAAQGRTT